MFRFLIIIGITAILVPSLYYLLYWVVRRVIRETTACEDLSLKQLDLERRISAFNDDIDQARVQLIEDITKFNSMAKFINNNNNDNNQE